MFNVSLLLVQCCHYENRSGQVTTKDPYPEAHEGAPTFSIGGRVPECWRQFYKAVAQRPLPLSNDCREGGTIFLGTLTAPDGHTRLVALDYEAGVDCQDWRSMFACRVFDCGSFLRPTAMLFERRYGGIMCDDDMGGDFRVFAGIRDAKDTSHVTFKYKDLSKDQDPFEDTIDVYLENEDQLILKPRRLASYGPTGPRHWDVCGVDGIQKRVQKAPSRGAFTR
jgi:hypothetical protein